MVRQTVISDCNYLTETVYFFGKTIQSQVSSLIKLKRRAASDLPFVLLFNVILFFPLLLKWDNGVPNEEMATSMSQLLIKNA